MQSQEDAAKLEIARLAACHPVFDVSKPPINIRFVWTQPFDLSWKRISPSRFRIEFKIQYAQSAFFDTPDEASKAQNFNPLFETPQRNEYELTPSGLRLLEHYSYLDKKWRIQHERIAKFSCWQTVISQEQKQ